MEPGEGRSEHRVLEGEEGGGELLNQSCGQEKDDQNIGFWKVGRRVVNY